MKCILGHNKREDIKRIAKEYIDLPYDLAYIVVEYFYEDWYRIRGDNLTEIVMIDESKYLLKKFKLKNVLSAPLYDYYTAFQIKYPLNFEHTSTIENIIRCEREKLERLIKEDIINISPDGNCCFLPIKFLP